MAAVFDFKWVAYTVAFIDSGEHFVITGDDKVSPYCLYLVRFCIDWRTICELLAMGIDLR